MSRQSARALEGSHAFVAVTVNRDSLEPVAAALSGPCLHRNVCDERSRAKEFSSSRGHPVYPIELPSRAVSLSVGELAAGQRSGNHRHAYETLVYVLSGRGHSVIEGEQVSWQAGDAFYVAPWQWHQHVASRDTSVQYLAATNLPVLSALGQTVLRQEEAHTQE